MERYKKLYTYLLNNGSRWITQKEICDNIEGYYYHDRKNDKAPMIREDMKLINEDTNCNFIVVCKKYCFKIGNREETKAYRNERIRRLKAQVKMLKDIDFKINRDKHYDLLKQEFYDIFEITN